MKLPFKAIPTANFGKVLRLFQSLLSNIFQDPRYGFKTLFKSSRNFSAEGRGIGGNDLVLSINQHEARDSCDSVCFFKIRIKNIINHRAKRAQWNIFVYNNPPESTQKLRKS